MSARSIGFTLVCLVVAAPAGAQWAVTVKPTMDPLPAGFCAAVHLTVTDPVLKDIPRNPQGYRVTMADFDMAVTTPGGTAAVGQQIDASHWNACSCQGATSGTVATVTATYPAQALPAASRVPGVSVQQTATFTVAPPKGTVNPVGCQSGGTSIASTSPPPSSTPPAASTPPASASPPAASTPPSAGGSTPGASAATPGPVAVAGGGTAPKTPGAVVWINPAWAKAVQTGQGLVQLTWAAVPGINDYEITGPGFITPYTARGTTTLLVNAQSGANSTWTVGSVYSPRQASTANYTKATVQLVHMQNPTGLTAVETSPGQVRLSWTGAPGVAYYGLFGPGVAAGGEQLGPGTVTFTATSVPAGQQQWSIGSYYMPGQLNLGLASFPTTTATVTTPPIVTGKYLVTVTALRAYQASMDDVLSRDGVGDEVYAAAYVRKYDRKTGTIVDFTNLQSAAYGDVNKFGTQRIQAGTRSGTGGIQDGDAIPSGSFAVTRATPAQTVTFPWRLWEGTLTNDVDALIITPSIWEQDGGTPLYDAWVQQQAALNISLFASQSVQNQITSNAFGALVSGAQGIGGGGWFGAQSKGVVDMQLMHLGLPLATILSTSNDRPIGMLGNGVDEAMLPNRAIVLTREIIEAALAQPALGPIPSPVQNSPAAMARIPVMAAKPGVIMLQFEDHGMPGMFIFSERPAIYQMFVQVERVP